MSDTSASDTSVDLGEFTQYEIPDPLTYVMRDNDGNPITLSGLTGLFVFRRVGGNAIVKVGAGVVDVAADQNVDRGKITWTPIAGDFGEPGLYVAEFIAADPTEEHRSVRLTWRVHAAVDTDTDLSMHGICELWATADDLDKCGGVPTPDQALTERMLVAASVVCFRLGGSRWPGICTDTVQPGADACVPMTMAWPSPGGVSRAGTSQTLRLSTLPVVSVTEIRLDGDVLDPAAYMIVDDEAVVRVDGGTWPSNTDVRIQPPHLELDVEYGARPTELGRRAAAVLARELLLAACSDDSCRLDRRVTSIVREGVTIDQAAMPGLIDALVQGHIGLPELDLFVATENPSKLRREGRFVIPGDPRLNDHRVR